MSPLFLGVMFVMAASGGILLVAHNPHGGEHLRDLLAGQILWVSPDRLPAQALIAVLIAAAWFALGERLDVDADVRLRFGGDLRFDGAHEAPSRNKTKMIVIQAPRQP